MPKSASRKSKGSRGSRTSRKRKVGPYARFVKANFHKYYKAGSRNAKTAFKSAAKQVAAAYRRSH